MEDARDEQGADDADYPDAEPGRSAPEPRERNFVEVNRWSHDDHSKEQIDEFIRRHIKHINDSAGLTSYPGAHKDRKSIYGLLSYGRTWYTRKGTVTNIVLRCPLMDRCKCKCEVKLSISAEQTIMYVTNQHTAEDHAKQKDISKGLAYEDKRLLQQAVKLAPMQSAGSLMRNIQDSPTKKIDYSLATSVRNFVRK